MKSGTVTVKRSAMTDGLLERTGGSRTGEIIEYRERFGVYVVRFPNGYECGFDESELEGAW